MTPPNNKKQAEQKQEQQPQQQGMAGAVDYKNGVPVFRVRVSNVESPGHPIEFTIGPKTMKSIPSGEKFHLIDGGIYDLPVDVVQHLNSCAVPKMEWVYSTEPDIRTGEPRMGIVSQRVGQLNRFSVMPSGWGSFASPPAHNDQVHTAPPAQGPLAE